MSRIHEALKRAEQERAAREKLAPPAEPPPAELSLPPVTEPANASGEAIGQEPFVPPFPAEGFGPSAVTAENIGARCRQPEWNPDQKNLLFAKDESRQYKAEVFRTLRSRLYRIRDQMTLRTLLITSTLPAEGKSFVAANLGHAIAQQHGRRALLIDADLRVPRLHTLLGAPQGPGLTEYLRGEADEFSVIQRGPLDGIYFLPSGDITANPVELIGNGRLKDLLHRLNVVFDWIILDSPPMAPVSDASLLADMCDGALLVVRASATPFDLAQKACAEFKTSPVVGVVLNRIDQGSAYGHYYYTYYGSDSVKTKG